MAIGDMVVPFTLDNSENYEVDINPETRIINVPEDFILGVESDEKAQRVFFTCPKIVGYDFDMSKASVYINFENANGEKDAYRVEDLNVNEELEEVTFSWLLSRKVTAYKGQVNFIVCAKISNENGIIQQEWNTTVATAISLVGLEAIAQIEQENYDILEEILRKVKNIEENGADVDLSAYQKKTDNELETNDKTIVGAINEIKDNQRDLPIASSTQLGGVKPVAKTDEMTQEVGVDEAGGLFTKEGDGIDEETLNQINRNTEDISKLSDEIDDLKENGLNQNIDEAVANYLSENPISGGLTSTAKNLLITILRNSLYSNNQSENITALETALGQSSSDTTVYYSITNTLTNVTNNNSNTQVLENTSYIASLSANNGYTLESITVTMGGIDITSSVYADGVITVSNVTGDIIITANAIISTTSNDELITDGLLAYVDGRTCTYNNSNSNGTTTIIPNQGSGQFFAWAKDGVEVQDEYGLHFASSRDHMYDKDGGTNESDLGTQFTVVHLTKGHVGFGSAFKNLAPYWMFKPYYITTSGSRMDITDSSSYNGDSKDDYNFMVYRVDGTKLTQIMDTSRVDRDGSTIDGFASWNAKVGLGMQMQNADGMYVTAFAVYNRALSDVEIEEMRAFFKTLEVSA